MNSRDAGAPRSETFAEARSGMQAMGEVYRALSSAYGERLA
ncbi:hypothetical protein [Aquisalimonas asiatica]|uniref:Uncharacterized protein n=1 Tax=Aquisalimonas asiatica TaxID=406100 RepID=A0A1H8UZ58_9GAMM|nr:hypothetical protein [Aquisalimonas asiatica]SEP08431.1 hypothetical protein SAMN04488052_1093 [Aquisalimonas asiatica]